MKQALSFIPFLLSTMVVTSLAAQQKDCVQPLWSMHYGGSGNEQFQRLISSSTGGFVAVGYSESTNGDLTGNRGGRDMWVVRLDSLGKILWQRNLGGSQDEVAKDVVELPGGDLLVLGSTSSVDGDVTGNHGAEDVWLVRLDANGQIIWTRTFGGSLSESAERLLSTGDGFLVAGYSQSADGDVPFNRGDFDYWVFKIDASGNLLWSNTYGGTLADWAYSITAADGGRFFVAGSTFSNDGDVSGNQGFYDFWIIKINAQGQLIWDKNFGGSLEERLYTAHAAPDGGLLIAGTTLSTNGDIPSTFGSYDVWLLRLDPNGQILWNRSFGGAQEDRAFAVIPIEDGWLIGAYTSSQNGTVAANYGIRDAWLLRVDDTGNLLWEKNFGGSADDRFYGLALTTSGGYAATGLSSSSDFDLNGNFGQRDAWVIVLRPDSLLVELGNDTLICAGQQVVLKTGLSDVLHLWSNGTTSDSLAVQASGLYWVEVDHNGCKARDSILVEVAGQVPLYLGPDTLLCQGQTLLLKPDIEGDTFTWQDGSTKPEFLVSQPGTYWVEVLAGPCRVRDTIVVDFLTVDVSLGPDTLLCEGQTLLLDASTPGADYLWQDGSVEPTLLVTEPGEYTVRVGQYGCFRFDTIRVDYQFRPDSLVPDYRYFCEGKPIALKPPVEGAKFIWPDGNAYDIYRLYSPGVWTVGIELNGCLFFDTIELDDCMKCLYVPNAFSPNGDGVNDEFKAYPACPLLEFEMRVFNRWGQLVYLSNNPNDGWDGFVDGKLAMPGHYVWLVKFALANGPNTIQLQRKGGVTLMY